MSSFSSQFILCFFCCRITHHPNYGIWIVLFCSFFISILHLQFKTQNVLPFKMFYRCCIKRSDGDMVCIVVNVFCLCTEPVNIHLNRFHFRTHHKAWNTGLSVVSRPSRRPTSSTSVNNYKYSSWPSRSCLIIAVSSSLLVSSEALSLKTCPDKVGLHFTSSESD